MFDFDNLREIFSTIKKNKLRTFLTGFSVAWGIFMLIVLLGAGNGLRNGIMYNFKNMSANKVSVWPGRSTMPYKGMPTNRSVRFKDSDLEALKRELPEIDMINAVVYHTDTISYGEEYGTYSMRAVFPAHAIIDNLEMPIGSGRFINAVDLKEKRKVIVISPRMKEVLFRKEDPLGKHVNAGNVTYQVIGVYKDENNSNDAPSYIPFSTGQTLYNSGYGIGQISFTLKGLDTKEANEAFETRFREKMGARHHFDPTDKSALYIWNTAEDFIMLGGITNGITLFLWIIGIGTLTAGIVGVSNIMLITVRERTREFGIRKAIGATPFSILKLIIFESILITAAFGYIGMVMGIGVTETISYVMDTMNTSNNVSQDDMTVFRNPTVSLNIALAATGLLILSGVLAGYYPASKAVKVTAIEAMRTE